MGRRHATTGEIPRERLAELVSAASYGTVLVLAALSVISVSEVAHGHGAELVAGVGVATWLAHLFAEILGGHVRILAIVVAVLQLAGIGAVVAASAPTRPAARWTYAVSTAAVGLAIVALSVALGH